MPALTFAIWMLVIFLAGGIAGSVFTQWRMHRG